MEQGKYYVIRVSEDGDVRVYEFTKEQLEAELSEQGSGFDNKSYITQPSKNGSDPSRWGHQLMIIKGQAVTPSVKTVVKTLELP